SAAAARINRAKHNLAGNANIAAGGEPAAPTGPFRPAAGGQGGVLGVDAAPNAGAHQASARPPSGGSSHKGNPAYPGRGIEYQFVAGAARRRSRSGGSAHRSRPA